MKIIITGAAGFIGYHLSMNLLEKGFDILGIDSLNNYYDVDLKNSRLKKLLNFEKFSFKKADISVKSQIKNAFKSFQPDRVVNLASQPSARFSVDNPDVYIKSNLIGFFNVIELCKQNNIGGLIYASSSSVYGSNKKIPFSINDDTNSPISLYGVTKLSNELMAYTYSHLYDLPTTGLRYFSVYGPWYRPDMAMHIFINKIIKNEKISVFNNGNLKRDFTYIDDIIDGTVSAINCNYNCEIFNLGNNKSEKLIDMIKIIEDSLNKKAIIDFLPMQLGDVAETYADINYSKAKLNYNPKIDISKGIPYLIKWYKDYYNV